VLRCSRCRSFASAQGVVGCSSIRPVEVIAPSKTWWPDAGENEPTLAFTLLGHEAATAVAFGPDGNTLATVDPQGVIRLWDAAPEKEKVESGRYQHFSNRVCLQSVLQLATRIRCRTALSLTGIEGCVMGRRWTQTRAHCRSSATLSDVAHIAAKRSPTAAIGGRWAWRPIGPTSRIWRFTDSAL
jgi:WD40 repeat protein